MFDDVKHAQSRMMLLDLGLDSICRAEISLELTDVFLSPGDVRTKRSTSMNISLSRLAYAKPISALGNHSATHQPAPRI